MTPPRTIPSNLINQFTLNNRIPVKEFYLDDSSNKNGIAEYNSDTVNSLIHKVSIKDTGGYGDTDKWLYEAFEKYPIKNKKVAIIGSVSPWYESICLFYEAIPYTIEYNKINNHDERLHVMTVDEYNNNPMVFDAAISISSFEHDGLGRYGDPINPIGDLTAMKKTKEMVEKKGLLFLSVPTGKDMLLWNIHRVYGRIRLPMLFEGWELIDSYGYDNSTCDLDCYTHQPIYILSNI